MDPTALLAQVRARLRRVVALGGAARLVALLVLAGGAAVLADRIWFLPGGLRLVLLTAIAAAGVSLVWRRLVRPLRAPLPDRDLAAFVERRVPALDGRLLSAVDGIALSAPETALALAALPPRPAQVLVPGRTLPAVAGTAGIALALAGLVALASPPFWRDGLIRLLLPLSAHEWERSSALSITVERAVVAADEPVTVVVERSRGRSGAVRIGWSGSQGESGTRQLSGSGGPWRQALTLAPGRWTLSASGGDAYPVSTRVLVVDRPVLDRACARLTPPAYSGLPAQDLPTPGCQVLPGSHLDLRLHVAVPAGRSLATVSAQLGGAPIKLSRDGEDWTGSLTAGTAAADLTIAAADADGIALRPASRFPIAIEPDRPPSVSLAGPRPDEAVGPHARVAVAVEAGDDLGLASLALSAATAKAGEPRTLHQEQLDGRRSATRRVQVDVAALAAPGGSITLLGRAADRNDVSGPGIGTSAPLVLKVVTEDELRRDLERQLAEARDRVGQARSSLAPGLADRAKLPPGARAAGQDAARVAELLARVQRRWSENALEAERIAPAGEAQAAAEAAGAPLAKAAGGDQEAGRAADAALDRAERALDRMLSDSDLTRIVALLLEREKALAGETRAFVRAHLTEAPDEVAQGLQRDLAARQRELAARTAEVERKVLAAAALEAAKSAVRDGIPAEHMNRAADEVASEDRRPQAMADQGEAVAALEKLLAALRGGDAAATLARRVGELAERQARLADAIEQGADPEAAARDQQRLREETARLAEEAKDNPDARQAMAAAQGEQQGAEGALAKGDRPAGARDAGTAADLLRRAQKALDPSVEPEQPKDGRQTADVLALLRALFDQQAKVLADSLPVYRRIIEEDPDFAAKRDLAAVAQIQDDVLLRLREEGIKALDQQPIALAVVKRVEGAMARTLEHLRKPALGEHGLRLERIALYELKRLIDVADHRPQGQPGGGGGGGGGQGEQPPFPPAAEIALLIAEQDDIRAALAAGRPADLAARQDALNKLVMLVEKGARPGTRFGVLMLRARRSVAEAGLLLGRKETGGEVRDNMASGREALTQLLAEAKGGGGSGQKPNKPKPQDGQQQEPPKPGGGGAQPGAAVAGGATAKPGDGQAATGVIAGQERSDLLQLPPARREQLRQAREERLPAGALQLYERYLEKLEER